MDIIISHIYRDNEENKKINKMISEFRDHLEYNPSEIALMNDVAETFYKHEKYYLD